MLRPSEALVKPAATRKNRHQSSVQSRVAKQVQTTYQQKNRVPGTRPLLWVKLDVSYQATRNGFI